MSDDLRSQLAQAMKPEIAYVAHTATDNDIEDAAYSAADALLARFAVAGPLPDTRPGLHLPQRGSMERRLHEPARVPRSQRSNRLHRTVLLEHPPR